eukprot:GAFH01006088.1.p1 GENE.GAFH01006088.1~~GAFH01006088.1.p1  ORF type:complete len:158 (+),score=14.55 GAFH01006088.1:46-474(+)
MEDLPFPTRALAQWYSASLLSFGFVLLIGKPQFFSNFFMGLLIFDIWRVISLVNIAIAHHTFSWLLCASVVLSLVASGARVLWLVSFRGSKAARRATPFAGPGAEPEKAPAAEDRPEPRTRDPAKQFFAEHWEAYERSSPTR